MRAPHFVTVALVLAAPGCGGGSGARPASVQWIGVDTRPLAVGSQIPVSLEFATDGGPPAYSVSSSDPSVVSVTDQGNQQLLLTVLAAGNADLTLQSALGTASQGLIAAVPFAVSFSVQSHLAAGLDIPLPQTFDLIVAGSEVVQAEVLNQAGEALNSWGLVAGRSSALALIVTKIEPEQFALTASAATASGSAEFVAGLAGDGGQAAIYTVGLTEPASSVGLIFDGGVVLARGLAPDNRTEVFGLGEWQFTCQPSDSCTADQLSLCAARLTLPAGAPKGSLTVTGQVAAFPGASQLLTGSLSLP